MTLSAHMKLLDGMWPMLALAPVVPSSAAPPLVSLKGYSRCSVLINAKNATTVTGAAIGLQQAKTVGGTPKLLPFTEMYQIADVSAGRTFTKTAVASNSFTTQAVDSKTAMYLIDVPIELMDIANEYDCVGVTVGNATAATISAYYLLYAPRHAGHTIDPGVN